MNNTAMDNTVLWAKYKRAPSVNLKKQIIVNYTNLVHYVIHNSKFVGLNIVDERDFFQFGIEGLSEAIDRFDPEFGTKFETYAIQRIRGKIIDELRKIHSKPRYEGNSDRDNRYRNISLNHSYDDDDGYMLYETLPSDAETPDEILNKSEEKQLLIEAIKELDERDRLIITLYYYENLNYKEIADVLNITVSRVSQIHTKLMHDLKNKITRQYDR